MDSAKLKSNEEADINKTEMSTNESNDLVQIKAGISSTLEDHPNRVVTARYT